MFCLCMHLVGVVYRLKSPVWGKECLDGRLIPSWDLVQSPFPSCGKASTSGSLMSMMNPFWHNVLYTNKASENSFRTITLDEVPDFVKWDIHHNNWFQVWGTVM